MSKIKIRYSDHALDEWELNRYYEDQGFELVSVNHVTTEEWMPGVGPESFKHSVVKWVYHFKDTRNVERGDDGQS
jgi:hypothetical protein